MPGASNLYSYPCLAIQKEPPYMGLIVLHCNSGGYGKPKVTHACLTLKW